jgi:PPOX class probable F420-dependent enzyme
MVIDRRSGQPTTGHHGLMTSEEARDRFAAQRVARLATVDAQGCPHLVPIVFAVAGDTVVHAVDRKPKRTHRLRRLRNISVNPQVCLLADAYDESDWTRLWWVRADGRGRILQTDDPKSREAIDLLVARYPQYRQARPEGSVVAIDVERWSGWSGDG